MNEYTDGICWFPKNEQDGLVGMNHLQAKRAWSLVANVKVSTRTHVFPLGMTTPPSWAPCTKIHFAPAQWGTLLLKSSKTSEKKDQKTFWLRTGSNIRKITPAGIGCSDHFPYKTTGRYLSTRRKELWTPFFLQNTTSFKAKGQKTFWKEKHFAVEKKTCD